MICTRLLGQHYFIRIWLTTSYEESIASLCLYVKDRLPGLCLKKKPSGSGLECGHMTADAVGNDSELNMSLGRRFLAMNFACTFHNKLNFLLNLVRAFCLWLV